TRRSRTPLARHSLGYLCDREAHRLDPRAVAAKGLAAVLVEGAGGGIRTASARLARQAPTLSLLPCGRRWREARNEGFLSANSNERWTLGENPLARLATIAASHPLPQGARVR